VLGKYNYVWTQNNFLKQGTIWHPAFQKVTTHYPFICHVQKVEKLKSLCLQYATSIQLLIPSIEVAAPEKKSKSGLSKAARIKKSQERDQQLKLASENVVMTESILYVSHIFQPIHQLLRPAC
jgi:hypothetical protein